MITIEFSTKDKTSYLVDVVGQKIRYLRKKGKPVPKPKWIKYRELLGDGKIGKSLTIIWTKTKSQKTGPVTDLKIQ
jgi:hypothetical protein